MRAVATAKQGGDCMQEHHGNDMVTCPASDSLDAIMREADELIVGASPRKQQAVRSMARAHSLDVFMQVFDAQRKRDPYQSASTRHTTTRVQPFRERFRQREISQQQQAIASVAPAALS